MRLRRLYLLAWGPFTDRVLDFGAGARRLVLVHGPNEAGKSSTLRAISDLRFGIPLQSRDNFVHPHPDMRVGGVFEDRDGREVALVRRKGRGATLMLADFSRTDPITDTPAPPGFEALLTGGLTREAYETTFGLDHARLRAGGEALLAGEGEIGAALFEASAGVRSVPQVLEGLNQSARSLFMPGARGKNAPINAALTAYREHQSALRHALVRPASWAELFRRHQAARDEVQALEERHASIHRDLLLVRELRAVAPLLGVLDHATRTLAVLHDAPLLSEQAPAERAAAQAGLDAARRDIAAAAEEAERQRRRLATLPADAAALAAAAAIRRIAASVDGYERHRAVLAEALRERDARLAEVEARGARIFGVALTADAVPARLPSAAARAALDERLEALVEAERALVRQREAEQEASETDDAPAPPLPDHAARVALRTAQDALARHAAHRARLAALPAAIDATRRALASDLGGLGLEDASALAAIRPLLEAEIAEADDARREAATRRREREQRIDAIGRAVAERCAERDRLLATGPVPTADALRAARARRDLGWAHVRAVYAQAAPLPAEPFADGPLLPAYEAAVAEADRLADALAHDRERAAQLQSVRAALAALERDRETLSAEVAAIARAQHALEADWEARLRAARIRSMSPAALRDWQVLLARARASADALRALEDEARHLQAAEAALARQLVVAISGTGLAMPAADATLDELAASAEALAAEIARRETDAAAAEGRRQQRVRHLERLATRAAGLSEARHRARTALDPLLPGIALAPGASIATVRARLAELDALAAEFDRLEAARDASRAAEQALATMRADAIALAALLGEPAPADLRLYAERLSLRLEAAERAERERALAEQALDAAVERLRRGEQEAAVHASRLAGLCAAAGVASDALLPEAEARAQRRREAQALLDRTQTQLAQASRRPVDALRALLADRDAAALDADEAASTRAQAQVDDDLRGAREREEAARRALQAVDGTDVAAAEREAMERAAARVRSLMPTWMRSRIAHALLAEALGRFRERAQAPMLRAAAGCFARMTDGEFTRLLADDDGPRPVLLAERRGGGRIGVDAMSEGTRDQLYLALRLAALDLRRQAGVDLPVILDDVLMTSDDRRAGRMLQALADFAAGGQVLVFTHHRHLVDVARAHVTQDALAVVDLAAASAD